LLYTPRILAPQPPCPGTFGYIAEATRLTRGDKHIRTYLEGIIESKECCISDAFLPYSMIYHLKANNYLCGKYVVWLQLDLKLTKNIEIFLRKW